MRAVLWTILICVDVLLILCFIAGYAAAYVHPKTLWFIQIVAIGLPYLSIGIVLATLLLALLGSWKLFILHLPLCLLVAIRFLPADRVFRSANASVESIKVMTYNAKCRGCADDEGDRRLAQLLARAEPDLVAFQESAVWFTGRNPTVTATPNLQAVLSDSHYVTVRPERPHHVHLSQPVFSRASRADLKIVEVTQTALPNVHDNSSFTRVHFRWKGQDAVLYNLHLYSYRSKPWDGENSRPGGMRRWIKLLRDFQRDMIVQAREAEQIRARLDQEDAPVIITGDLNNTPHSWAFRHLAEGYKDAFELAGRGWGATYHSTMPLVRIDHILVSPEWRIAATRVPQTTYSDHLPVIAEIWLADD